ncbi:MAG: hypothetical protein ACRCZN_01950 [Lactococcus lactis]
MAVEGIDTKGIAKIFQQEVTDNLAHFFQAEVTLKAQQAARREKFVRGANGKKYSYSKWQNTGQLARNIKITKDGNKKLVNDGTRANYSNGSYHGMYFLVEKRGEKEIKAILKKGTKYAESLKL